jgi:NADH-quinone oxidoreductase subunit H
VFYGKALVIIFVFRRTRWSLPRFRFDQILGIAWQGLVPMSLALFVVSALTVWAFGGYPRIDGGILPFRMGAAILAGNIAVLAATVIIARLARGPVTKVPNKRIPIAGSRFTRSPLPAGVVPTNAL